ncbi:MAG: hypothetical protein GEU92_02905 [Alphaproteobacteria bacterium]|nr:hypothetical protein [Alphaproteobacteria bacterium]
MPEELRHDIDSGRTGDKVPASDPAVTPLGTDEEAAGSAPDPEAVTRTREEERRSAAGISARPHQPRPGGSMAFRGAVLAVLALLLVGLFIAF